MSVIDIPLRKALQLFYADQPLRIKLLKEDIRLERRKEAGGTRSRGGDFYLPFWSDVKSHISGDGELAELVERRITTNRTYQRLYHLLKDGILDLLTAKLRWSNEPIEIVAKSVHGDLRLPDIGSTIRIKDALHARVREDFVRVVYPYFSEEPALSEEGGRLGLWAMQQALPAFRPEDMRIIDPLRKSFFSPSTTMLQGNEAALFLSKYHSLVDDWQRLRQEFE